MDVSASLKYVRAPPKSKKSLNETEICDQFITPAIHAAGWDKHIQVRREHSFTAGQVLVRGVAIPGAEGAQVRAWLADGEAAAKPDLAVHK